MAMKNKLLPLLLLVLCLILAACGSERAATDGGPMDYGTLTIADVEDLSTQEGTRARLRPQFSNPEYKEDVTYSFEGNDIVIENGYVTALVGGKTVTVTAKTSHHEVTFTVTTVAFYGKLSIEDVYAWVDYPESELDVFFSIPEMAEALTYEYDETALTVDPEKKTVKALKTGTYTVKARSENFSASFTVSVPAVDTTGSRYDTTPFNNYLNTLRDTWFQSGHTDKTTLFIGDSFFDVRYFWTNFYTTYADKDALCCGIGSTTTFDWEVFTESFLKYTAPKNIVMHMGTNNVYDDQTSVEETVSGLQRMFYLMHEAVPNAKITWFTVTHRGYGPEQQAIVDAVNDAMQRWCANRSWIDCIDTSSQLTADMLFDSVHPKLEHYAVFVDALKKAGLEMIDK